MVFIALPVTFKQELQNEVTKEGGQAVLSCELSKPCTQVDWRKGRVILKPNDKYEIKQEGTFTKLVIHNVEASDAGSYSCKTKDSESTAELTVKGKACRLFVEAAWHIFRLFWLAVMIFLLLLVLKSSASLCFEGLHGFVVK